LRELDILICSIRGVASANPSIYTTHIMLIRVALEESLRWENDKKKMQSW